MTANKPHVKELRVSIGQERYDWLRANGESAGFRSMSSSIRDLIDKHIFEQLYLKGNYGKENSKQIKDLLKAIEKRKYMSA